MSQRLSAALKAEGGILAELARSSPDSGVPSGPAHKAASGPRTAHRRGEYELLLEMILEGSRLHYGAPQVVRTDDPDLALLVGDQLYALGLARLAALGDLEAVRILAETIASLAQTHAEGHPDRWEQIWAEAALRIGWDPEAVPGAGPGHPSAS
ncbi:MAG TPA: hypothetical protein VMU90_10030 [Solirubrobacteraceae bacterium]|nr:hypothetical protein [Solirubrobacteraceae bacterium]